MKSQPELGSPSGPFRASSPISKKLATFGALCKGRRNHYELHTESPFRHPVAAHRDVSLLLQLILGQRRPNRSDIVRSERMRFQNDDGTQIAHASAVRDSRREGRLPRTCPSTSPGLFLRGHRVAIWGRPIRLGTELVFGSQHGLVTWVHSSDGHLVRTAIRSDRRRDGVLPPTRGSTCTGR